MSRGDACVALVISIIYRLPAMSDSAYHNEQLIEVSYETAFMDASQYKN
jgi:hypothetical protein